MIEKLFLTLFGIAFGFVLAKLFSHIQMHELKNRLIESDKNNEKIIQDNANLVRENTKLRDRLSELDKFCPKDLPDFKDW